MSDQSSGKESRLTCGVCFIMYTDKYIRMHIISRCVLRRKRDLIGDGGQRILHYRFVLVVDIGKIKMCHDMVTAV